MTIFIATAAGIVTILIGATGCVRRIYRRGKVAGKAEAALEEERLAQAEAQAEAQAKVKSLEAQVTQIQNEAQAKVKALEAQVTQIQAELDLIRVQKPRVSS
jgi:multidrug resistance efflux pump